MQTFLLCGLEGEGPHSVSPCHWEIDSLHASECLYSYCVPSP